MKIGIVTAMPIELEFILNHVTMEQTESLKQNLFYIAKHGEHQLVMVASGIGKTNAATYTQILTDFFNPDCLINIGIAGGLKAGLKPLDLIVGSSYSHHDVRIEQMTHHFPHTFMFTPHKGLLAFFSNNISESISGSIVSGEQFIADTEQKEMIISQFNAVAVDMETSAIAHTCLINEMPFLSLRCLSDLANDDADDAYESNELSASDYVGKTLLDTLSLEGFDESLLD